MEKNIVIKYAIWLKTTRDIDEKKIMIDKDCRFLILFNLVSSLRND